MLRYAEGRPPYLICNLHSYLHFASSTIGATKQDGRQLYLDSASLTPPACPRRVLLDANAPAARLFLPQAAPAPAPAPNSIRLADLQGDLDQDGKIDEVTTCGDHDTRALHKPACLP